MPQAISKAPSIEVLTNHLASCPDIFLKAPRQGTKGSIHVAAVVSDVLFKKSHILLTEADQKTFSKTKSSETNYLRQVLICSWLINHEFFLSDACDQNKLLSFLKDGLKKLSEIVDASQLVSDPDRREELARLLLKAIHAVPFDETPAQAEDRLKALDSVERARVIQETRQKLEHARKLKAALEAKRAAEAASRYSRE